MIPSYLTICEILDCLKSLYDTDKRSKSQALAIYLFWLKTGLPHRLIACHFEVVDHFDVNRILKQVRKALTNDFVCFNLGVDHKERGEWLNNNTKISEELFSNKSDQLILVCDGTYAKVQRSSNNKFQRETYSCHKKYHLVKPFVVTCTNGYIVDIYNLSKATKNDASILKEVIHQDLGELINQDDIFLLDRGFKDVVDELKDEFHIIVKIPAFKDKDKKQLSSEEANFSRLVTKCRYVVEVTNSFVKNSFRALEGLNNRSLDHILDDYRIPAALINRYFKRLYSD